MARGGAFRAGGWTTLALAALLVLVSVPSAAHAITREAAESKALRALEVRDESKPVVVFGTPKTIRAGAVVTEAGDAMAHSGNRAGLRTIAAPVVITNGDERAWLFHEDRGPYQQFAHPGRVVLVEQSSGKVRISRQIRWAPLVDGDMLPWFETAGSYEREDLRVFQRGIGGIARATRNIARAAQATPEQLASRRRVADALAAERSCALRVSDTLGNFFDYSGVDRTRARFGRLLEQLERLNAGFVSQRYSRKSGRTPAAELARLIDRRGCKDVLLYVAGGGYSDGPAAVNVGVAPRGNRRLRLQDVSSDSLERVMKAHGDVTFKFVIDAPFAGRMADKLVDEPNMAIMLTSGGRDEPSYTFVPNAITGGRVIRGEVNAGQLLEFTSRVARGVETFIDSPLDVDFALSERAAGRAQSMMVWMLGRGVVLGDALAASLPTTPVIRLGGGFAPPKGPPFTPPGPPAIPPGQAKKNDPPDAKSSTVNAVEDTPVTVPLQASDPDGDSLTYSITDQPDHGTLSGSGATRAYTPAENFTGTDSFTFKVDDGRGGTDTATVTLPVAAVDDDARIITTPAGLTYTENGAPIVVDPALTITDVDTSTLSSATVAVAGGGAGDVLAFTDTADISGTYNAASGVLTLTGTASVAAYEAALRSVTFSHAGEAPSTAGRTVTFAASGGSGERGITVVAVNDAPVNTVPGAQTVAEDGLKVLTAANGNAVSIADPDAGTDAISVTLSAVHGTLSLAAMDGLTFTTGDGNGDASMTFTGPLSSVNAALASLGYAPDANYNGSDTLSLVTSDLGRNGTGGVKTDSETIAVTVTAVDDAPVNTVPATTQTLVEEGTLSFGSANRVSVADLDAGNDPVKLKLDVEHGTLDLGSVAGLTFSRGDGTDDAGLTFTGTLTAVNAALDGLVYAPDTNFNGSDTLTIVSDDQGSTGAGGPLTDTDTVALSVSAVNDAPVNTVPGAQTLNEDATKAISPSVADVDAAGDAVEVKLDVEHGVLDLTTTSGLTFTRGNGDDDAGLTFTGTLTAVNAALDGLLYAPAANYNGADTLTLVTSDQGSTGSGGAKTDTDTVAFTISAVNDAPVNTVPGAQTLNEDATKTLTVSVADVDDTDVEVKLDVLHGLIDLPTTSGLTFTRGNGDDDAGMTFSGTKANVNAALTNLVYAPSLDYNGADTLTLVSDDGDVTDTDTVGLTVSAVNDAPVNTVPGFTQTLNEDGTKTLGGASTMSISDVDVAGGDVQVKLDVLHGTLDLSTVDGLTFTRGDGTDDAGMTFTGTLAKAKSAIMGAVYAPDADYNGSDTLTLVTDDQGNTGSGGAKTDTDTVAFTIAAVNDAPVNTVPGAQTLNEDATKTLTVSVADVDDTNVEVKLDVLHGLIDVPTTTGLTFTRGNGDDDAGMTFSGTKAAVNAALTNLVYAPELNYNGADTLTLVSDDGDATDTDTVAFTVSAVNDAPVNTVPGAQTLNEDATKTLSASVADVDDTNVEVKLDVLHGLIDLPTTSGLTFTRGNGDDDAGMTFSGTKANVNAALTNLVYAPALDYNGADTLTLVSDDGDATDTDTVAFTVNAVNDAPVNTVPAAQTFNEDATKTLTASVIDVDDTTLVVKLDVLHGLVDLPTTTGLTFTRGDGTDDAGMTFSGTKGAINTALDGLVYTPDLNYNGADTLTLVSDDGDLTDTDTVAFTVSAANDAPVNTVPSATQTLNEDATKAITLSVADLDADSLRVKLDVLHGRIDLPSTAGLTFTRGDGDDDAGMTFSGTKAAINTALDGLVYAPDLNYNGADTLTVETSDLGATGAGDEQTDTDTVTFSVAAVNDAPVNTVPGAQTLNEDATQTLTASVADVDDTNVEVKLDVLHGLIDLPTTTGLTFTRGNGDDDAGMTFNGTKAAVNAALDGLLYAPAQNYNGADTLTLVSDDGELTDTDTVGFTVSAVNDAPVNTVPGAQTLNEDTTKLISASVADADSGSSTLQVVLTATNGTLTAPLPAGGSRTGNATGSLTLTGTQAALNTALADVVYTPAADYNGADTLTLVTSDQGATGSGGAKTDTDTASLTVSAVNDAPTLTVPAGTQALDEDSQTQLTLSAADVDASSVAATLTVLHGTITLATTSGLTFTAGANDSATMTFEGTIGDVNAAMNGLTYTPATNYNGADTLSASVSDKGATGSGGTKTDSDTVTFAIAERNTAPVNHVPGAQTFAEDVNRVFSTANGNAITFSDPDAAADDDIETRLQSTHGTLDVTGPTGPLTSISGDGSNDVTLRGTMSELAAALEGLVYDPDQDYNGAANINVILADLGNRGSGGQKMDNDDIPLTITAVNDAPVLTVPGAQSVNEDATLVFNSANTNAISIADADGGSGERQVSLAVGSGTLTLSTTSGLTFTAGANGTGAMTFQGTLADLNAALAGLQYKDAADQSGSRTLTVTADDLGNTGGAAKTDSETVALTVTPQNDPATVNLSGATPSFTEDGSAVVVDGGLSISDVDDTEFTAARVEVTDEQTGDTLTFDPGTTGIVDTADGETHTLVLSKSGGASKADWEAVLQSVKYSTPSQEPGSSRTVAFQVNDGDGLGTAANKTVAVVATPDGPVITPTNGSTDYTEDAPAVTVDSGVTVTAGGDPQIDRGTVSITSGLQSGDTLSFTPTANIAGTYNAGVLTLTTPGAAEASAAEWQTALQSVKFASTNQDPVASKTIEFKLNDGTDDSNAPTKEITVTALNDAPAITVPGTALTFTEGDAAKAVAGSITVSDAEGHAISGAEAEVTSGFTAGQDSLSWTDNEPADGIEPDFVLSTASKIVLTGPGTAAQYAAALANVKFDNADQNPADGDRVVTFRAKDTGTPNATGTATRAVNVDPVDDPPVAVNDTHTLDEDSPATTIPVRDNDTDIDGGPKTIANPSDPAHGTTTLAGGELQYAPDANYCGADSFTYELNGGSQATVSMTVTCINDAPIADDETFTGENGAIGNTTLVVDDASDPAPAPSHPKKTITPTDGDLLHGDDDVDHDEATLIVTRVFSDTNGTGRTEDGGTVTVEDDGDFVYTPDPADSCADAEDTFKYEVSDPDGAKGVGTVTVAIAGCVWYVKNDAPTGAGNDDGASDSPFRTLAQAEAKTVANQTVFVFKGSGTSAGYDDATGYQMHANERLIGEHEGLTVDPDQNGTLGSESLYPATPNAHPALTATNADVIALDDANEVRGFTIDPDGTGSSGIAGGSGDIGGGTIDDVKILDTGTAGTAPAFELVGTGGTFAVTNLLVDNTAVAAPPTSSWGVHVQSATADFGSTTIKRKNARGLNGSSANLQTSTFDEIVVTGSTTGGVKLQTLTGTTSIALGDGQGTDLDLHTASGSDPALYADGVPSNALSVDGAGTDNLNASGGPALDVRSAPSALTLDIVSSAASGSDAVNLENLGSTPFVASSGTLSGTTGGVVFDVHGGSGDITYPGTFNNNFVDTIVEITGRTGGTNLFSGSISDGGGNGGGVVVGGAAGNANTAGTTEFSGTTKTLNTGVLPGVVFTNSDGHTLRFTNGGLAITATTPTGFAATTAGTIEVSGANNTITTTTGRALEVTDTDIGPNDLTFRSITSNGAANGIVLNNTTNPNGRLVVAGNGGSCTSAASCSGGAIQNSSGAGISMNSVPGGASLTRMAVNGGQDDGIRATTVGTSNSATGLAIDTSWINGNGNAAGERGLDGDNVRGFSSINATTFTGSAEENARIDNDNGTLDLKVTGSTFSSNSSTLGSDGLQLYGDGNATMRSSIANSTFQANRDDGFQMTTSGTNTATMHTAFTSNTVIANGNAGQVSANAGVTISPGDASTSRFHMNGGTINGSDGSALILNPLGTAQFDATVENIQIGTTGVAQSGSKTGIGLWAKPVQGAKARIAIRNNTIQQYAQNGMYLRHNDGTSGTADFTVTGNTIINPNPGLRGIYLESGATSLDTQVVCADIGGGGGLANSVSTSGGQGLEDIYVTKYANSTFRFPGLTNNTDAGIKAYLEARNSGNGAPTAFYETAGGPAPVTGNNSPCMQPTLPTAPAP